MRGYDFQPQKTTEFFTYPVSCSLRARVSEPALVVQLSALSYFCGATEPTVWVKLSGESVGRLGCGQLCKAMLGSHRTNKLPEDQVPWKYFRQVAWNINASDSSPSHNLIASAKL